MCGQENAAFWHKNAETGTNFESVFGMKKWALFSDFERKQFLNQKGGKKGETESKFTG